MTEEITTQMSEMKIERENEKIQQQTIMKDEEKSGHESENKGNRRQRRGREGREGRDEEAVVLERGVKGHVKWYNVWQHYGFIGRDDDPSADVFVHQSGIARSRTINPRYRTLDVDEKVLFDVVAGKGDGMKKAVNVTGPDGEKVRGCYFFEQYIRNFAYYDRRNNRRGTARLRYKDGMKKGRKNMEKDEKNKKRTSEKNVGDNEENKVRKHNRSTSISLKEEKHGEPRRNTGPRKEVKATKDGEKLPEVTGNDANVHVDNEVHVDA